MTTKTHNIVDLTESNGGMDKQEHGPWWSTELLSGLTLTCAAGVRWPPLPVAVLAHSDGGAPPAPLRHGHPVAGAGMAETLPTRSTMMFPLSFFKQLLASVAGLKGIRQSSMRLLWPPVTRQNGVSSRTHRDLHIRSPVRGGHLVSEPGRNGFGWTGTVLRHRLDHKVHPIQNPLRGVLLAAQEGVRLEEERQISQPYPPPPHDNTKISQPCSPRTAF